MSLLVVGLILFLGVHSVSILAPAWRDAQVERRGERVWKGAYALVSLAGLVLLIHGYGVARQAPVVLYTPPPALQHVALLLMLPVFPLLFAAYLPGRIQRAARNPMLLAVALWAMAHLLANGTLADVLLFGAFLVWAVADWISVKGRAVPRSVPGAPPGALNDIAALAGGLVVYVGFLFWAHIWLTGVSPVVWQ
ncbi:MAG: NnrU family protein [Variovorax sp.]|nr:MAG: NnrU family protein [Variovorax sp.]